MNLQVLLSPVVHSIFGFKGELLLCDYPLPTYACRSGVSRDSGLTKLGGGHGVQNTVMSYLYVT